MNDNKNGIGTACFMLMGLLNIAFVVLKLTGFIDWSWWWILSPIWVPVAAVIALFLVVLVYVFIKTLIKEIRRIRKTSALSSSLDKEASKYGLQRRQDETDTELLKRIALMRQAVRRRKK